MYIYIYIYIYVYKFFNPDLHLNHGAPALLDAYTLGRATELQQQTVEAATRPPISMELQKGL